MTALTRVALACGAALIMATAALGALDTADEREPVVRDQVVAPRPLVEDLGMPTASELDLEGLPDGVWVTR